MLIGALVASGLFGVTAARAMSVAPDVWFGGGFSYPKYHAASEACVRAGAGAVFASHLTLGVSGHADRDRFHYFGDAGVLFPGYGMFTPYGRFQVGRRDDRSDTAWGWCGGVRLSSYGVGLYLEWFSIQKPEQNYGLTFGMSF